MKKLITFLTISVVALGLPDSAFSAEKKKTKASEESQSAEAGVEKKEKSSTTKPLPFQGTVDTVDAAAGTFTTKTKDGKVHTFTVTEETVVTKDEAPAKLEDLTSGEAVRGTRVKTGDNQWQAVKVMIGKKPETEKKKKTKSKKEKEESEAPAAEEAM